MRGDELAAQDKRALLAFLGFGAKARAWLALRRVFKDRRGVWGAVLRILIMY
jgi:hypothetical protein